MKLETYTQCRLKRGSAEDVAWIPSKFAQPGRVIRIKIDGKWSDGWMVDRVFGTLSRHVVETRAHDHTHIVTHEQ